MWTIVITNEEIWTDIENDRVTKKYYISSRGRVKNADNKILNQKITTTGYYAVSLTTRTGNRWFLVHQLVANNFVFKPSFNGELVPNHIDDNKLNNLFENLEWVSRSENIKLGFKTGAINNTGENNGTATVTDEMVHSICKLLEDGEIYDNMITKLSLPNTRQTRQLLARIKNGVKWTSISSNYEIKKETSLNKTQEEIVSKLPYIREMIVKGLRDFEIHDIIWGKDNPSRKSRCMTISNIRKNKIYVEY